MGLWQAGDPVGAERGRPAAPQQKLVYQLCYQEGLKYEEAADRLHLSTLTVQSYMKLALRHVRKYMSKHADVAVLLIVFKLF